MTKRGVLTLVVSVSLVAKAAIAGASPVPELDPSVASMGLGLLAGGLLVFNGRRRRR